MHLLMGVVALLCLSFAFTPVMGIAQYFIHIG